jgi:hypothetical protein
MAKLRYEWFLFSYQDGVLDVISKAFKTKAAAEKARRKYPPKVLRGIGVGISHIPNTRVKRKSKRRSS